MQPILERVDKLTNLGIDAVQTTVSAYTHYIFFSSLFYIIFAVILFLAGIKLWKSETFFESKGASGLGIVGGVAMMLIACVVFVNMFPNFISPKAMAIEKVIMELKR